MERKVNNTLNTYGGTDRGSVIRRGQDRPGALNAELILDGFPD